MRKQTKKIIKKSLENKKNKLKKDNMALPWVAKIKNEIESMGHEKYVEDVDKFFKDLKKHGVEKVLFGDV
ncbi:conserved hypothetical protein [Methanocaldococcus vulcanius M7]|uniref:Uncharacterized protein n=1 Tax=Methanocaldococcus vulcanius (strain ATCC 700851 / DSM 12094 / M7) TaxID=579137 RepID=C9RH31_METVM|nr:hypothetical protein [Methanocaldococcus vulcanius]ACX72883.1 conserved hypothetical protein [Methanocaldococcus vulcanius M7]